MLSDAKTAALEKGLCPDPTGLLTIIMQMEADLALEQRPSVLAAGPQGHTYGNFMALQTNGSSLGHL